MEKRYKYIVMSNRVASSIWEESLVESLGICHTLKKAYHIALFLGRISKPDSGYRRVLETIKVNGAYTIQQLDGPEAATIVKVRIYA